MAGWKREILLGDLVEGWKRGEYDIPGLAEKVVERIEKSGWLADTPYPDTLRDHLGRVRQAVTEDDYRIAFEYVYDVADDDRVWLGVY